MVQIRSGKEFRLYVCVLQNAAMDVMTWQRSHSLLPPADQHHLLDHRCSDLKEEDTLFSAVSKSSNL